MRNLYRDVRTINKNFEIQKEGKSRQPIKQFLLEIELTKGKLI